jgi:hypothetical protein
MSIRASLAAGASLLALAIGGAQDARAEAVELEGTWHVLVHFRDSAATNAEEERWEDRVWVFAREGGELRWTDYPIVVFDDESGRFEGRSRVLEYWEPSAGQLEQLAQGPKVNARGSRSKRLRAHGDGWASAGGPTSQSATVITFTADWSVENLSSLPVFRLEDALGSAMTDSLEGATIYQTELVEEGGRVLRGRFERDGTRRGTFRMLRTPPSRGLGTQAEQRARVEEKRHRMERDALLAASGAGGGRFEKLVAALRQDGPTPSHQRELREFLTGLVDDPTAREQTAREIENLVAEGKSADQILAELSGGGEAPR